MASTVFNARMSSLIPGSHNVSFHNKFFLTYLLNGKNYDCLAFLLLNTMIILFPFEYLFWSYFYPSLMLESSKGLDV